MGTLLSFFQNLGPALAKLLGYADTELTALSTMLASISATLASDFPGGVGLNTYLLTVEKWVTEAEDFVQSLEGVPMSPAEAKQIGAVTKPLDSEGKRAFVVREMSKVYPTLSGYKHKLALEGYYSALRQSRGPKK